MHWTDDELKALYQLAAVQPRDWSRIADSLRQRYPDRRQYTIGSIQQKYNDAVRTPVWGDDECAALLKFGKQFEGQWDRITQLMKLSFGDQHRPYIGEILERKWKRLKRDVEAASGLSPCESDLDSACTDPHGARTTGPPVPIKVETPCAPPVSVTPTPDGIATWLAPRPPALSSVSVPLWPVAAHHPRDSANAQKSADATPAPDAEGRVEDRPGSNLTSEVIFENGASVHDDGDCFKFDPEEAAEILADFGCQFVSELELALSRPGSSSMAGTIRQESLTDSPQCNGNVSRPTLHRIRSRTLFVTDLELSAVATLVDGRDRARNEYSDPGDGEIDVTLDLDAAQPAKHHVTSSYEFQSEQCPSSQVPSSTEPKHASATQPTVNAAGAEDGGADAGDSRDIPGAVPAPTPSVSDVSPDAAQAVVPALAVHSADDADSSGNEIADDDSKAPISRRIQIRRKSSTAVAPGQGQHGGRVPDSDPSPVRSRKRAMSLGHSEALTAKYPRRSKDAATDSETESRRPRRRTRDDDESEPRRRRWADTETETELSRRRSRSSTDSKPGRKRKMDLSSDQDSSNSEPLPRRGRSPRKPRTRRFSDADVRLGLRSRPAPVSEVRKQTVWTEEEEQLLATLRRQHGRDYEKIGAALQARFPNVRPYTIVSVRCKWNYMLRHQHPLAFESNDEASSTDAMAKPKPERPSSPVAPAAPPINVTPVQCATGDDGDDAICDADAVSGSDVGEGVVALTDATDLLATFLPRDADSDVDDTSVTDRRRSQSKEGHISDGGDDLAICDI